MENGEIVIGIQEADVYPLAADQFVGLEMANTGRGGGGLTSPKMSRLLLGQVKSLKDVSNT